MLNVAGTAGAPFLTAAEIAQRLGSEFGITLHWRTIQTELSKASGLVARRKRNHQWQYQLMASGREVLGEKSSGVRVIDPVHAVQAVSSLHDFFESLTGDVAICDPYVDASSVDHLDSCPKTAALRILTVNIKDSGRLRALVKAFASAGRRLEIREAASGTHHDRYLVDDKRMIIMGTSLNGFGKKQCFLIDAGVEIRKVMLADFEKSWAAAKAWP